MGKKKQNRKGKRGGGEKGVISFIHFFVRPEDSPLTLNHPFNIIDPSPSPCLPLSNQPCGFTTHHLYQTTERPSWDFWTNSLHGLRQSSSDHSLLNSLVRFLSGAWLLLTVSRLWNLSIPTLRTCQHVITNYFSLLPGSANQAPALQLSPLALDFIMLSHNQP